MSYHSSQNRRPAAIRFRWRFPSVDPAYIALLSAIKDVRAAAGQEGVEKFIAEWRKRGYLDCSDEDAKHLAEPR